MARDDMRRGYARARERDDALRAELEPLGPDERPWPLVASAALAALIALGNLVALAAGATVNGSHPVVPALLIAAVTGALAVGLWQRRYLAVLAWEALLGVTMIYAALSLMLAANLAAVLVCVLVLAIAAPLFWLLIRVMARIQVPPN
jgi:hypothetical protein